jgi:pyruvate/2-oxoglutarate dehydrogenase complex dihydrolipoamide dehydrogenase (E3) component
MHAFEGAPAPRRAVVISVGSAAALPPIPVLEDVGPRTNREITTTEQIPNRLVILGGGVVGVEMADALTTLGSEVVVIEAAERLIAREEPFASQLIHEALSGRGVDVRVGIAARGVTRQPDGHVRVELADGTAVEGDQILVATGRRPRTGDLGLETVGLTPGRFVEVDERLRVPEVPWLYAIGDANGRSLLTHVAKYQARVPADLLHGSRGEGLADNPGSPRVIFTEPQIAAVRLTLQQAIDGGMDAHAYDAPSAAMAGASFHGRGAPGTSVAA